MSYEIEVRSLLSDEASREIAARLDVDMAASSRENRFTIVHVGRPDFFPDPDRELDLKFRTNGEVVRITAKLGSWHSAVTRRELEFLVSHDQLRNVLLFFNGLGYDHFIAMYQVRRVWRKGDRTVTLDHFPFSGHHILEVEETSDSEGDLPAAERRVREFLATMNLIELSSEETQAYVQEMNNTKRSQITIADMDIEDWLVQNKQYVDCVA